jgi:hypothetical protein
MLLKARSRQLLEERLIRERAWSSMTGERLSISTPHVRAVSGSAHRDADAKSA